MRSNDTTTPPADGMHAPESPVPEPRARERHAGVRRELDDARDLGGVAGRTTASGCCGCAVSASSCV